MSVNAVAYHAGDDLQDTYCLDCIDLAMRKYNYDQDPVPADYLDVLELQEEDGTYLKCDECGKEIKVNPIDEPIN